MRRVKIYYGLSGTLKSTTIKTLKADVVMWSSIKVWKNKRDKLFPWLNPETNLNYALLHLTRLSDYKGEEDLMIERGVSDMLFYESRVNSNKITNLTCHNTVKDELDTLEGAEIEKILLVMKDENFIREKVLKEPTRKDWFNDVSEYLSEQDEYTKFTKKYNEITREIVIGDAKEYLASLGLEYNV